MSREFKEEAGMDLPHWKSYCTMHFKDAVGYGEVECFFQIGNVYAAHTVEDEEIEIHDVAELMNRPDTIPNVRWLVQMARSIAFGERAEGFVVTEHNLL